MNYRIGELAEKCEVNKETIRYYERKGLIEEPERTDSGYRLYTDETVKRVRFIKKIQDLGFSLSEIHKLLGVVDRDEVRCSDMFEFVSQKMQEIENQIRDLNRVKSMLSDLKECCPNQEHLFSCPIIETMFEV